MRTYTENDEIRIIPRIVWGAIFAGALTAVSIAALLIVLGIGIGFTTINPVSESDPLSGLGVGTVIWWVITNLIALYVGGMVSGRMAGFISKTDGGLHGFLSWCVYAVVSLFFISSMIGAVIAGVSGAVGAVAGGGEQKVVVEVQDQRRQQDGEPQQGLFQKAREQITQLINRASQLNILPQDAAENVNEAIDEGTAEMQEIWRDLELDENIQEFVNELSIEFKDGNLQIQADGEFINTEKIKSYLAENTELTEQEIGQMVDEWNQAIDEATTKIENFYQEAKQKAEEVADKAADKIATISLVSFLLFVVGAAAAWFGGFMAAKSNPMLLQEEHRESL